MTNLDTRLKQAKQVLDNSSVKDRAIACSVAFCLAYGASPTPLRLASLSGKPVNEVEAYAENILSKYEEYEDTILANIDKGRNNETNSVK